MLAFEKLLLVLIFTVELVLFLLFVMTVFGILDLNCDCVLRADCAEDVWDEAGGQLILVYHERLRLSHDHRWRVIELRGRLVEDWGLISQSEEPILGLVKSHVGWALILVVEGGATWLLGLEVEGGIGWWPRIGATLRLIVIDKLRSLWARSIVAAISVLWVSADSECVVW